MMLTWLSRLPFDRMAGFLVLVSLLFVLGCSGEASISGTVRYKEQTLGSGIVVFIGADGKPLGGSINAQGEYAIPKVPAGKYTVTVETIPPSPKQVMYGVEGPDPQKAKALMKELEEKGLVTFPSAEAPEKYVKIPDRYKDAAKSGLSFEVTGGENRIDLKLVD